MAALYQTSFLIPNLHCSSCVAHIRALVDSVDSKPQLESVSIVDHVMTVSHSPQLSASQIAHLFEQSGYSVFDVLVDPRSHEKPVIRDPPKNKEAPEFQDAIHRWLAPDGDVPHDARLAHQEHCQECKQHDALLDNTSSLLGVTVVEANATHKTYKASLLIDGMTCSSCVGTAARALESLPSVQSADVNLVSNSATVLFSTPGKPDQSCDELISAIEDVGYDAKLASLQQQVKSPREHDKPSWKEQWQATFAISGMTCSSCVGSITNAVKALDFVKRVHVNLIQHAGTVVFSSNKEDVGKIREAIQDAGFDASQTDLFKLDTDSEAGTQSRTVSIKVQGMHCPHCPGRVLDALRLLDLVVDKSLASKDPIVTLTYTPDAPKLTVRNILAAISQVDPSFTVSVYHPMSLEQRSRQLLQRERRNIWLRVILTFVAAIPTLIIGIIYMDLVSSNNSGRQYLMAREHGVPRAEWAMFALATPVYFCAADLFHKRMLREVWTLWRPRSPVPLRRRFYRFGSMNMLISFGTTIAYFASLAELIIAAIDRTNDSTNETNESYFGSVVFLTLFLLAGRLIEAHMKAKSGDAVAELGKLRPSEATLIIASDEKANGSPSTMRVAVDLIDIGDVIRTNSGETPPCDGIILTGESRFDESSLTGESKPIAKHPGDSVLTGTVNIANTVTIKVTGTAGNSMLDSIIQVVREGQAKRAPVERVADSITSYFVPIVCAIGVTTWIVWLALGVSGTLPQDYKDTDMGGWPFWSLKFAIAVFVIACPCGLGLAAPTALFVGGGLAAKRGILVKGGGEAFQEASALDCVVLDKTGTITEGGEPKITDDEVLLDAAGGGVETSFLLGAVKAIEECSNHPLARAVVSFAGSEGAKSVKVTDVSEIPGKGLVGSASLKDTATASRLLIGNESLMTDHSISITPSTAETLDTWKSQGKSVILVAISRPSTTTTASPVSPSSSTSASTLTPPFPSTTPTPPTLTAILAASDPIRPEAPHIIAALQSQHMDVWMLTGDNPATAKAIASQVHISESNIIAGVLPDQKAMEIKRLQASLPKKLSRKSRGGGKGRATIAMLGDGINDAPALSAADIGIAIGSGTDVAIASAGFVLLTSNLNSLLVLIKLSKAVFGRVRMNFFWAAVYNVVALPIAAGVLYPVKNGGEHVRLDPVWAALAMALSSISVVCSSLLLRSKIPGVGFRG